MTSSMDLREAHMVPLASDSTCYSGVRCPSKDLHENDSYWFATETHALKVSRRRAGEEEGDPCFVSDFGPYRLETTTTTSTLTESSSCSWKDASCVGYSCCTARDVNDSSDTLYEAFVLKELSPNVENDTNSAQNIDSSSSKDVPAAWLVLQQTRNSLDGQNAVVHHHSVGLTFSPLAIHVTCISSQICIWMGSSNDAEVRIYIRDEHKNELILLRLDVSDESEKRDKQMEDGFFFNSSCSDSPPRGPFEFDTPIMAMDSLMYKDSTVFAIACQDGTIRLCVVSGEHEGSMLHLLCHSVYSMLVDGPLLALYLCCNPNLQVFVGSMCGFVCVLHGTSTDGEETTRLHWTEPAMVVDNLQYNNMPDAVISVCAWTHNNEDTMVALGTMSGSCSLLKQTEEGSYQTVWSRPLPYAIHGICHIPHNHVQLLVTTKRTMHFFRPIENQFSAERAKERILELMRERGLVE